MLQSLSTLSAAGESSAPFDIGSRLELFVDGALVDRLDGDIQLRLNRPVPREAVLELEKPWEGSIIYFTVFEDDGIVRLYYSARPPLRGQQVACVAESRDGIHFVRPELGIYEDYYGDPGNNVVWHGGPAGHHFTPFIDTNPATPDDQRYKGLARRSGGAGFGAYYSPDGLRWEVAPEAIFSSSPSDSQNVAFWDPLREMYVAYAREFVEIDGRRHRTIRRAYSKDFFDGWTETGAITYADDRAENLYTNGILPYFRAPHIYIGLAGRFVVGRHKVEGHPEGGMGEGALIASRDGMHFHRWEDAFIRPGTDAEAWGDRNHFPAFGMVQTSPEEISVYWNEHYRYDSARVRRGTLRTDGFVSVSAGAGGGELLTQPFVFSGDRLLVNYETSASGSIEVVLTDEDGVDITEFSTGSTLYGNEIEQVVVWRGNGDVGRLAGQPVRLRVRMKDADFYSFRFDTAEAIRDRLMSVRLEAEAILTRPVSGFFTNGLPRLEDKFRLLDNRLANDSDITQGAIQSATMVQRQIAAYREVESIAAQAEAELVRAEALIGSEQQHGQLYQVPVRLLADSVRFGLSDEATTPEGLSGNVKRLQAAIRDWEQLLAVRDSAATVVAATAPLVETPRQGFAGAYQNLVASRQESLGALLNDPDVALGQLHAGIAGLNSAVDEYLRLPDESPALQPVAVPNLPFTLNIDFSSPMDSGLYVGARVTPQGLVLDQGQAAVFSGSESFAVADGVDALKPEQVTIEAWVRIEDQRLRWVPIMWLGGDILRGSNAEGHAYMLWTHLGQLEFAMGGPDGHQVRLRARDTTLKAGEWHHVAGQYDGKTARIFVDGELVGEQAYNGGMDYHFSDVLYLGGRYGSRRNSWFSGQLRDVRVWAEARSPEQIRNGKDVGLSGDESNLVGAWIAGTLFGQGATLDDLSPSANPATLENAGWVFANGYWLSDPIDIGSRPVASGKIDWLQRIEGNPRLASIRVEAGYSPTPDLLPERWQRCNAGELPTGLSNRDPVEERFLWLRVSMDRSDPSALPVMKSIRLELVE